MKKSVSLSIPRPCAEPWSNFTPTPGGGFCGSCQKTVIDFSRMSDQQILDYLRQKRGAHTCGRFRADQLKTYTFPDPNSIRPGFMLLRAGILSLLLLFTSRPAGSKNTEPVMPAVEATHSTAHPGASVAAVVRGDHWVKGVVRDESGAPVPGASVYRKGTTQGTLTDVDGRFEFPYKLKTGDVLTISFLGYASVDYVVPGEGAGDVVISLGPEYMLTGELVLDTPYEEAPGFDPGTPAPAAPRR